MTFERGEMTLRLVNPDCLKWMTNKLVRLNRGGPESRKGRLASVKDDHLVLYTDLQYVYYQTRQVESITVDAWENIPDEETPAQIPEKFLDVPRFRDILERMIYRAVQINRAGPDTVKGILFRLRDDCVDLVCGSEWIKVAIPHIHNIGYDFHFNVSQKQNRSADDGDAGQNSAKEAETDGLTAQASSVSTAASDDGDAESYEDDFAAHTPAYDESIFAETPGMQVAETQDIYAAETQDGDLPAHPPISDSDNLMAAPDVDMVATRTDIVPAPYEATATLPAASENAVSVPAKRRQIRRKRHPLRIRRTKCLRRSASIRFASVKRKRINKKPKLSSFLKKRNDTPMKKRPSVLRARKKAQRGRKPRAHKPGNVALVWLARPNLRII